MIKRGQRGLKHKEREEESKKGTTIIRRKDATQWVNGRKVSACFKGI